MAMTGDVISAQTALEWGLINEVVADDELEVATLALIERACRGSRESKGIGKMAYYRQIRMNESDAYAFASAVMAEPIKPDAPKITNSILFSSQGCCLNN